MKLDLLAGSESADQEQTMQHYENFPAEFEPVLRFIRKDQVLLMALQTILYVEDEETDVLLFQLALKKAQIRNPLQTAAHAEEAVAYLSGSDPFHDREKYPLPGLVLLDFNLPGRSGMEVLQWIRQQEQFARVPVVVYTSSGAPKDRKQAKELGADDYIVKPCLLGQMATTLRKLKEQWLT